VSHEEEGLRYVYKPLVSRNSARKSALRHVVETFFDGSAEKAVAALLGGEASRLSEEELERIADLIAKTRKDGSR
jgi:predicted transcriptional regulator